MEINTSHVSSYLSVTIRDGGTTLELGLHDKDECKRLAQQLVDAANDIVRDGEYVFVPEED